MKIVIDLEDIRYCQSLASEVCGIELHPDEVRKLFADDSDFALRYFAEFDNADEVLLCKFWAEMVDEGLLAGSPDHPNFLTRRRWDSFRAAARQVGYTLAPEQEWKFSRFP